jgi:peptide/nickel transport system permease protein
MNIKNTYLSCKTLLSKNRALKLSVYVFLVFVCVALLAPFLANDKPLICKYKGQWLFPAFSFKNQQIISENEIINYNMGNEWKTLNTDFSVFAPCAYSPNTIDAANAPRKSPFAAQQFVLKNNTTISIPFKFRHWLGTTQNGNDVLSGIIHGTKISLSVGIFSMLIASIIGIILGASAGYFENDTLKIGYVQLLFLLIGIFISYFYCVVVRGSSLATDFTNGSALVILKIFFLLYLSYVVIAGLLKFGNKIDITLKTASKLNFPLDTIVSRVIEILNSIPSLLLIIALSAITKPSYTLLILIIGFLSWTTIARLTRAEYLKTKQLDYITSCKAIGMSHFAIMRKHILPNVFPIILVQIIFGMAGAVLIEASLSFIGVGIPSNTVSWGSLLNEARDHFTAWWLVVFPGLGVFVLIFIYNKIAAEISKINQL